MNTGVNKGFSDFGTLCLFAIPYVLGLAACIWLGFWMQARGFFNQLNQEGRRAIYVGAEKPSKSPLTITTPNTGSVKITRVDLDGSTASVYFVNTGNSTASFIAIHWQLVSPNGTRMTSGYHYSDSIGGPDTLGPGDTGEVVFSGDEGIALDKRAVEIIFWIP